MPRKKCASQGRCRYTAPVTAPPLLHQVSLDANWLQVPQQQLRGLPGHVRSYLLDEQSLTERLIEASGGNFRVERLRQGWQKPLLSERQILSIPDGQWALVREVALHCHDEPWVYARSVIPAATLKGKLRRLRHLQNQSLGAMLFKQPGLRRRQFELSLLPANSSFIHPDLRQATPAWARRSCFELAGDELLVCEVFLERFQAPGQAA